MINFFILMGVLVLTIGMIYLLNLKFNILKYLIKRKISFIFLSLLAAFLISLFVQFYENIYRLDNYWINKNGYLLEIIEDKEIMSKDEKVLQKYLKDFKPSLEENEKWNCYKKFVSKDVNFEMFDIVINSVRILQFSSIDNTCYKNTSKVFMDISYILVIVGLSFAIFSLLYKRLNLIIRKKNHSVVIGLNNNSRELISKLITQKENIKIYDNDNTNKYINELENIGEMIISEKLEYTIESNNCDIINTKEIYIINNSDTESLSNLSLLLNKFNNSKNRKIKYKTKIYIEIKNRENKAFFDKKGIYDELITDYYEIYPFSINEIIVQEMFKNKPLISNIKNKNGKYEENLKILIVGFNDLSEEILYNILKLGHFDLDKITEVTVIDDKYELLNSKYNKIIKRGKEPYENSDESLWKVKFSPYKSLYENIDFHRIILCDKELNNGLDILNYMNNNYHIQIREKNTIIQVFNEHKNINDTINSDENNFKNFSTFGDLETTITLDNIKNNNLYKVAEYTNDFKETEESKKWKNIDNFTRESNITEKLHMNIKLDIFDLHIVKDSKNKLKTKENFNAELLLENYYKANKENIKEEYLNEAIRLPYSIEILGKLYDYYLEKKFPDYKDTKSKIKTLEEKSKKNKELVIKELEDLKIILKDYQIKNRKSLEKDNFYKYVSKKLVFDISKSNSDNMEVMMVISLIDFYLKIKHKPNFEDIIHNLAQIEHTRWNALHILNGWKRRKEKGKCMINKEHFDLCDWETLNNEDKAVIKYDYKNIYQIPFVVHCLGDKIINYTKEKK